MTANGALDAVAEHVVEPVQWIRRRHERGYCAASVVVGGYPALADGDLTVRELPVASSSMDSGVFTVVAP